MFLVLFTFMKRDDSGHGVMMRPVALQADSAVPDAAWVPSVLAAQGEATARHTRRAAFTGSHSSYSPRSSPDSSDLESLALAASPWPPNASLLFYQKEVLMLLM